MKYSQELIILIFFVPVGKSPEAFASETSSGIFHTKTAPSSPTDTTVF